MRGYALTANSHPDAALVYITNVSADGRSGHAAVTANHRLAWVVQLKDVEIAHSQPSAGPSLMTRSTVQWVIDAMTGHYVEARDF